MGAPEAAAWHAVLLVCRECRKRSNGPHETKPKELVRELKSSIRSEQPRPRVLLSSCLGLCPKRATAVARVGGEAVITAIDSATDLKALSRR